MHVTCCLTLFICMQIQHVFLYKSSDKERENGLNCKDRNGNAIPCGPGPEDSLRPDDGEPCLPDEPDPGLGPNITGGKRRKGSVNDQQQMEEKEFYVQASVKADWNEAVRVCRQQGMQLASIENLQEQRQLEAELSSYGKRKPFSVWTNGKAGKNKGSLNWNYGGTSKNTNYTKWDDEESTQSCAECCVKVVKKWWMYTKMAADCSAEHYFVCQGKSQKGSDNNQQSKKKKEFQVKASFKADWKEASRSCLEQGMQLASIENKKEQFQLEATLSDYGAKVSDSFWTSGRIVQNDGYVWKNSGPIKKMNFVKWHDVESAESCDNCCMKVEKKTRMYDWKADDCSKEYHFICQVPVITKDSNPSKDCKRSYTIGKDFVKGIDEANARCKAIKMRLVSVETERKWQDIVVALKKFDPAAEYYYTRAVALGGEVHQSGPDYAYDIDDCDAGMNSISYVCESLTCEE